MPMPARTLKTFLRFMLEGFAHERPESLGPPWASQCLHEPELSGSFRNGLRRRWWAGYLHDSWATAREAPIHRLATHRIAEGDATARPRPGPRWLVWRTAPWSKLFKLVSAKQRGGHTSTCVTE